MKTTTGQTTKFAYADLYVKVGQHIKTNACACAGIEELSGRVREVNANFFTIDIDDRSERYTFLFDKKAPSDYWITIDGDLPEMNSKNIAILPDGVELPTKPNERIFTLDIDMTGWSQEKRDRFFHFAESYVNQQLQGGSYIPDLVIKRAHHYAHSMVSLKGL